MRRILQSVLFAAGIGVIMSACSNGEYTANPSGNANNSINPLNPLTTEQFTWSGTGPLSADVNGVHFVADTATWYLDSSGTNVFTGYSTKTGKSIVFNLNGVYAVNLYSLGYHIYKTQAAYVDKFTSSTHPDSNRMDVYQSYLGNSGEVKITENDSAYLNGLFYFQGITSDGKLVTVNNGAFKISKPH